MTEWKQQQICIKFYINFEHFSTETVRMIQKAKQWAAGDSQLQHDSVPALMQSFLQNIESRRWLRPLQPTFGALWLPAFPKTKITFEREEISDRWWDSGKYDGTEVSLFYV